MEAKQVKGLDNQTALDIVRSMKLPEQGEEDVTVGQAEKEWGCSYVTARKMLNEMVEDGRMEKIHGQLLSGRRGAFYRAK